MVLIKQKHVCPKDDFHPTKTPGESFVSCQKFVEGFEVLSHIGKAVSFFGSAAPKPKTKIL